MRISLALLVSLFAALSVLPSGLAEETDRDFFETKIRPLLSDNCFACHGPTTQMAGLNLSTADTFLKGGGSGPVIVKGEPESSRLIDVVQYQGPIKMPPSGKLKHHEIANLIAWVKMGASWPGSQTTPVAGPAAQPIPYRFSREQKEFWAFSPVKDYLPPSVKNQFWCESPVDRFILAELEKKGLTPAEPADKLTLLRRVTFDLIGLPPTLNEINDFLKDNLPDAFTRVVDRLLNSPRYGERWGRHWLDVARYADSAGADEDIRYPYAYRYRDYVIEAFNLDLSYDRFVKQQLAGDLMPAGKPGEMNTRGIVATGFLQVGPKLLAEQDKPKMVYDMVDEQLDVVSRAFMALTVGCARCHDHKFDPIPTRDYYSMASIFASTRSLNKVQSLVSELLFVPLVPKEVADRYREHQARIKMKSEQIQDLLDSEGARRAATLRPLLSKYMLAAWQYENRPPSLHNFAFNDWARREGLEPAILEHWIEYLKPADEVRPHLAAWLQNVESAASTLARQDPREQAIPAPPSSLVEVALNLQKESEVIATEWEEVLAKWKRKVDEANKVQMTPPEKPVFEKGKHRFFADVFLEKGPFALPDKGPEQVFSEEMRVKIASLRTEQEALKESSPPEPPMACAVEEGPNVQQRVFIRGNVANPGEEVPKQFLEIIAGEHQAPITRGSGRPELAEVQADLAAQLAALKDPP
jgi:mono/diheme cytochrome c family protein